MATADVVESIQKARGQVEHALSLATDWPGTDGRRNAMIARVLKWLSYSVDGLEQARQAIVEYEIEGRKK
jgi:hypothetical protein